VQWNLASRKDIKGTISSLLDSSLIFSLQHSSLDTDGLGETVINLSDLFRLRNETIPSIRPRELEKRLATSPPGTLKGCYCNVPSVGIFNSHFQVKDGDPNER
jgi:hypothetical protein